MIDLLPPSPRGAGFEPATLWLRAAACKTTGLYPSSPPSGTQNTLWYKKRKKQSNTFRIHPTPSEFIHHLQNLPNTFRIYPPPSEFTHHLQKKYVFKSLDLFGPFPKNPKIPKTSILAKMIYLKENYEKVERP